MPSAGANAATSAPSPVALCSSMQTVLWSKNGIICYALASENGQNLSITFLENIDGKNWQLAPPKGLTIRPLDSRTASALVLVQWSTISTDLAVFDEIGNFYILLAGVGLLRQPRLQKLTALKGKKGSNGVGNLIVSTPTPGVAVGPNVSKQTPNSKPAAFDAPSYELTSYNHTEMIYRDLQIGIGKEPLQDVCVAFKWLPVDKPQIVKKPAKWLHETGQYLYGIHQYKPLLVSHPLATKQACIAVRRSGLVNLYYQGEHKVEYHKLLVELGQGLSGEPLQLMRASIGFTPQKKIVIVAYDLVLDTILTYMLTLEWGFLVASALRQAKDPHYHTPKEEQTPPTMTAIMVHQMKPCAAANAEPGSDPSSVTGSSLSTGATDLYDKVAASASTARLVSIDVLSPYHAQSENTDVLLTYEHVKNSSVSFSSQRFQLQDVASTLAGSFLNIPSLTSPQTGSLYTLSLQDTLLAAGEVRGISLVFSETILIYTLANGLFLPVSRATWKVITDDAELDAHGKELENDSKTKSRFYPQSLASLLDCGFTFPALKSSDQFSAAISPNLTCVVYLSTATGSPKLVVLENSKFDAELGTYGLAYTHAHACYSNACSDDLLVLIRLQYMSMGAAERPLFLNRLIVEAHRAINFHLNSFGKDSVDKLLSNPPLQKLLSLQLSLSDLSENDKIRDMAWLVLHLRFISFVIMFTLSSIYRQIAKKKSVDDNIDDSIYRAECVYSLVGNVKWLMDFVVYINQELAQLGLCRQDKCGSRVTLENSLALPVLLCKIPRLFLMYALSLIEKTHEILKKLQKDLSESNKLYTPMKDALARFFGTCAGLPWKLTTFESFVRECEGLISEELSTKLERDQQLKWEQDLFCRGEIPQEYHLLATKVVDRYSQSIAREYNLLELFFYDTAWINVGTSQSLTPLSFSVGYNSTRAPNAADSSCFKSEGRIEVGTTGTLIRQPYMKTDAIDVLRKIFVKCLSPVFAGSSGAKVRKCVRCRSISLTSDPLVFEAPHVLALWTMVFQRTCICGSAWVNCTNS